MRRDPTTRDADDHRLLEVDELEATDVVDAHEGKASPMRRCQPGWHRIEYSPMVGAQSLLWWWGVHKYIGSISRMA